MDDLKFYLSMIIVITGAIMFGAWQESAQAGVSFLCAFLILGRLV